MQIYVCHHLKLKLLEAKLLMSELLNRVVMVLGNSPFTDSETTVFVGENLIFITVHNSSCGKIKFSQASVILSMGGCAWQGACMAGAMHHGGMHGGGAWQGTCMAGGGFAYRERRPLQRTVRILLECILVLGIVSKGGLRQQATQKTRTGKRVLHNKYL